jgi:fatty-acyl-CoA synthase
MWFGDWMARGALYWPDDVAVVDAAKGAQGRFTYSALNERANRLASWLRGRGVRPGDRVGVLAPNGIEVLDALFACGKLGAIVVPYNWRLHPAELAESVKLTEPSALLYSGELAPALAGVALPPVRVHLDGEGLPGRTEPYGAVLAAGSPAPIENARMKEDDVVVLLFTGGTTGLPKAASITYRQLAWNAFATIVHEVQPSDVTITHTPMFHTGGLLVYTLPILTVGGRVVLMRRWDPAACLRLLAEEGVTLFFAVPTQYQQLADAPAFAEADLSRLRFLTSGGAPMPDGLRERWQSAHRGVPFKQGFGMTEFGPGIFSMEPKDAIRKAGSIGRPNHFVEARLVDDARHEVAAGDVGELWLRGPACFAGYWKNPVATAGAIDGNGWFHTGDLARSDDEGFFTIVGRKKDMFISGGENVFPIEIEQALEAHRAVTQAAVVGVSDARWGEVGAAFVTFRAGATAGAEELLEHLRGRLARFKVPKTVRVLDAMPVSAAGKILKTELRRIAQEAME